jgi:hypothetical protein
VEVNEPEAGAEVEKPSGVVRAKAWPRDEEEPEAWTLEVPVPHVHLNGAPGIYGFSPQSKMRVYIDNISLVKAGKEPEAE